MSNPSTKPTCVSLHRLGQLSGKARGTLLLRMRDGELVPDALLELGGKPQPFLRCVLNITGLSRVLCDVLILLPA